MHSKTALTVAAALSTFSTALATQQGFNYASTFASGGPKQQSDFESAFKAAQSLEGTNGGFTDARLYTMIQSPSQNDVISAIPAALAVPGTHLLLGIWASGGQTGLDNELAALKSAISTYGSKLAGITNGIAVGSEDLYRESPTGIINKSGIGASPSTVADFISQVKKAIAGTALSHVPVGHVDTWTAWVNDTNSAVVEASDFIGTDAYPYFQNTFDNPITNGKSLFDDAYSQTVAHSQGKPVWITETGWPVSGKTENKAIPSTSNAKTYWDQVGCPRFGNTPIYWYTLEDADGTTPNPSFGVITPQSSKPLYDLSCKDISSSSASATSSGKSSKTSSGFVASGTAISGSSNSTSSSTAISGSGSGKPGSGSGSGSGAGSPGAGSTAGAGAGVTGHVGPTPTTTAGSSSFTGAAVANAGSMVGSFSVLLAVAAFLL